MCDMQEDKMHEGNFCDDCAPVRPHTPGKEVSKKDAIIENMIVEVCPECYTSNVLPLFVAGFRKCFLCHKVVSGIGEIRIAQLRDQISDAAIQEALKTLAD